MRRERKLVHIETPNGIINIRVGLHDAKGRLVDSIEVIPCATDDGHRVVRRGLANTRLVRLKRKR